MYVIDRIVGGIVICECLETGSIIELDKKSLPQAAKEGDVILKTDAEGYVIDKEQTQQRLDKLTVRMNALFKRH